MYRYDANEGGFPKIGDRVEVVRSGDEVDGLRGTIGGWGDYTMVTALIALDKPMDDGRTIVTWPVVCLKPTVSKEVELKWQKVLNDMDDINIKELTDGLKRVSLHSYEKQSGLDKDGFVLWAGGDRPVSDDALVQVKFRSGLKCAPVAGNKHPRICWTHRASNDYLSKWDIVAYKIVDNPNSFVIV